MWDQDPGRTSFESKMKWQLRGAGERRILSLGLWSLVDWARQWKVLHPCAALITNWTQWITHKIGRRCAGMA